MKKLQNNKYKTTLSNWTKKGLITAFGLALGVGQAFPTNAAIPSEPANSGSAAGRLAAIRRAVSEIADEATVANLGDPKSGRFLKKLAQWGNWANWGIGIIGATGISLGTISRTPNGAILTR